MSGEQLPQPPVDNAHAQSALAEHDPVRLWGADQEEFEHISFLKDSSYRYAHPYLHIVKKIGSFTFDCFIFAGQALSGMPSPEQLANTPPLDS